MSGLRSFAESIRTVIVFVVVVCGLGAGVSLAQIRVACVGDSITAGYGLGDPGTQSYPAQLQALLGNGYSVSNYGVSGATVLKRSDNTYWNSWAYRQSLQSSPAIVVIMLGTNDSKSWNWNARNFNTDYKALIAKYQGLRSRPKVYICLMPPVFIPNDFGTTFDPAFIQGTVVPAVQAISSQTGVPLIDNNTPFLGQPSLFLDGVHPNPQGAANIAATVRTAIAP